MIVLCLHQTPGAEWAKRTVGLPMCQHSNPITLVSTIISNIALSLKYRRAELKCLLSSDEPYDSEQRKHLEIEYFENKGVLQLEWFCSQLYKFIFFCKTGTH